VAARYADRVGRSLPNLTFYVVFAIWKMSVFFEGHWARHVRGTAVEFDFQHLEYGVPALAARARRIAESVG
jgi:hypothetical protein